MNLFHTFHPVSLRSIIILSSYLCLGLPSVLYPSGFPTKILYAFLISPMHDCYFIYFKFFLPSVSSHLQNVIFNCSIHNHLFSTDVVVSVLKTWRSCPTMECYFLTASCPPGEISQSGLVPCLKCPPDYNQTVEGQKFCYSGDGERIGVECLLLPCLNGGSCHSLGQGFFMCECSPGFIG
jgi:hypothetical protein